MSEAPSPRMPPERETGQPEGSPPLQPPPDLDWRRLSYVNSRTGRWWIHRVAPFAVHGEPAELLRRLERVVAAMPRTEVVEATGVRLHAVCRTRLGFRDDLVFRFSPAHGVVHVQSASRFGGFDLGVNRMRVGRVRRRLARHEAAAKEGIT